MASRSDFSNKQAENSDLTVSAGQLEANLLPDELEAKPAAERLFVVFGAAKLMLEAPEDRHADDREQNQDPDHRRQG